MTVSTSRIYCVPKRRGFVSPFSCKTNSVSSTSNPTTRPFSSPRMRLGDERKRKRRRESETGSSARSDSADRIKAFVSSGSCFAALTRSETLANSASRSSTSRLRAMYSNSLRSNLTSAGPRRATAITSSTFTSRISQWAMSAITLPTPIKATRLPTANSRSLKGGRLL